MSHRYGPLPSLVAIAAIALLLFGLTYANAVFGQDEDTAETVNELLKHSTACLYGIKL